MSNHETSKRIEFTLRQRNELSYLNNITRAIFRHLVVSSPLNFLAFFTVDVSEESLAAVHGWTRHLWWPVEEWFIPLCQTLIFIIKFFALIWHMVLIVWNFVPSSASKWLWLHNFLVVDIFVDPIVELLILKTSVVIGNQSLRDIFLLLRG